MPEERLAALRVAFAELKSCAATAKQIGDSDRQRQLGHHISVVAAEIGQIERQHVLAADWDDPDALSDARKVLDRLARQDADKNDEEDEDGGVCGLFGGSDDEEGFDDSATARAEVQDASSDGDSDDAGMGMGMFDEEEAESAAAAEPPEAISTRARVQATLHELGREGWTGSTPKVALQEWVQKKHRVPVKYTMDAGVASVAISIKGVRQRFEQPAAVCYDHNQDAQNAAAMVALYELTAAEPLPLYRTFAPYWKDLWLSWEADKANEQRAESKMVDAQMNDCLSRLVERAEAVAAGRRASNTSDLQTSLSWEHWHDEDERKQKQPAARRSGQSSSVGAVARVDDAESRRLLSRHQQMQKDSAYQQHVRSREQLPMWGAQGELVAAVETAQVVLVVGETGSGKSTQVPQFILDEYLQAGRGAECNIICTQPRRIAAISLAHRIAAERAEKCGVPGSHVGYHIRLEAAAAPSTRLMLCTTGILLRRMQGDPLLTGVSHVIIDEVHERDVNIDFLLLLLRDLLSARAGSADVRYPRLADCV